MRGFIMDNDEVLHVIDAPADADACWADLQRLNPDCTVVQVTGIEAHGESESGGSLAAVRRFLTTNPEWTSVKRDDAEGGTVTLSRRPEDKVLLPSIWRRALNFTAASAKHIVDGGRAVTDAVFEQRLALCVMCPKRVDSHCGACGCPLEVKASWSSEACPDGKWGT